MNKIAELLHDQHGSDYVSALQLFNVNAYEIEDKFQKALDDGLYQSDNILAFGRTPEQWAAEEAWSEIRNKVLTRWMKTIPRDQMIAMLTALSAIDPAATVEYLPGESLTTATMMRAWNDANPTENAIQINPDFLP